MLEEKLVLPEPIAFSSPEERAAAVAFFNAAFRAEESGLRQAHELSAVVATSDPELSECLRLYGDEEGWHRQLLTEFLSWLGGSVRPMGRTTRTFYSLYARARRMESIVLVNLMLRPLVRIINRQPIAQVETDFHYRVRVVCRNPEEAHVRALLLQSTGNGQLSLRRLESNDIEENGRVEVIAQLTAHSKNDVALEQVVGRLSLEPTVSAASWSVGPMLE